MGVILEVDYKQNTNGRRLLPHTRRRAFQSAGGTCGFQVQLKQKYTDRFAVQCCHTKSLLFRSQLTSLEAIDYLTYRWNINTSISVLSSSSVLIYATNRVCLYLVCSPAQNGTNNITKKLQKVLKVIRPWSSNTNWRFRAWLYTFYGGV